jgi:hypothetical protein
VCSNRFIWFKIDKMGSFSVNTVYTRNTAHGLISKILEKSQWAYLVNKIFSSEISPWTYARIQFFSSFKMRLKIHILSESRSVNLKLNFPP